jgi:predicted 2-oxoglutarate/Fe(II)-dependent dioxygenase YbiX
MSLNLHSEDYEGGHLCFPEYGSHMYKPETGGAVIFSCSLLHEVRDVVKGRRYVLLAFMYGERDAKIRDEYRKRLGTATG